MSLALEPKDEKHLLSPSIKMDKVTDDVLAPMVDSMGAGG